MGIFDKIFKGNTLYYPGCLTKFVAKDLNENYKKILNKIGIDFILLSDLELCCGNPLLNAGHKEKSKELAIKNFNLFKERGVKKIITSCPACYNMFNQIYPTLLDGWNIKAEHITVTISNAMKSKKISPKKLGVDITYHDPCHLGRYAGIYDEPRDIVGSIGNIKEMKLTKNYSFCCGGGSGVKTNQPELSSSIAKERVKMAKETKAKILCTSCPMCYLHLKENSGDLNVMEISQFFDTDKKNETN